MKSVWTDKTDRIINKVNKISCCVPLTILYLKKTFFKLRRPTNDAPGIAENWLSISSGLKFSEHSWEVGVNVHFARLTRTKLIHSHLLFVSCFFGNLCNLMFFEGSDQPRTNGSVGWASGCHAGGCEFNSGRTNTQGLKIPKNKCYLCNYISKWLDFKSSP